MRGKVGRRRRGIPGVIHPNEIAARKDSGSETPGCNGSGEGLRNMRVSWCNGARGSLRNVMSSIKDRYGLYGYGGLGEWL